MKFWHAISRIAGAPYQWASHPRVRASSLSIIGAFVGLFLFISGLYLTAIATYEARHSLFLSFAALLILPATVIVVWFASLIDYLVRIAWHSRAQMADVPAIRRARPHCYMCGGTQNLTNDHIPPKGFFPRDSRENLVTAPLCRECHRPFSKMDEQMRVWISGGAAKTSEKAKWIWKNKVVKNTFKRSQKLRKYIAEKHLHKMSVDTPAGPVIADVITMPQGKVHPFIRRLTKGFLYAFYPDHDYFADSFEIVYQPEVSEAVELATKLSSCSFGKDVCRVWHGLTKDNTKCGVWIFLFYGAACFVCFHGDSKLIIPQQMDKGHEESSDLPSQL